MCCSIRCIITLSCCTFSLILPLCLSVALKSCHALSPSISHCLSSLSAIEFGSSTMAVLVVLLFMAMTTHASATWCVCKDGISDTVLQKTLDYACGEGADCAPTHKNGPCFNPDTVKAHCSYAVNSYYQKKGQAPDSCDFSGTATVTTSDPSYSGCSYPASRSTAGTPTTTPTTGILGVSPTAAGGGMNPDYPNDSPILHSSKALSLLFSGLIALHLLG